MCVREDVERSIINDNSRLKTAKNYYPLGVLSSGEAGKPDRFFSRVFLFFNLAFRSTLVFEVC